MWWYMILVHMELECHLHVNLLHSDRLPPTQKITITIFINCQNHLRWPSEGYSIWSRRICITQFQACFGVIIVKGEIWTAEDIQGFGKISEIFPIITLIHCKRTNIHNNWLWLLWRHAKACSGLKGWAGDALILYKGREKSEKKSGNESLFLWKRIQHFWDTNKNTKSAWCGRVGATSTLTIPTANVFICSKMNMSSKCRLWAQLKDYLLKVELSVILASFSYMAEADPGGGQVHFASHA